MARPRWNDFWRPSARRICAWVALMGYVATAVGFPFPSAPHKDASQPFPCQDHPCGCQTAEQCWRHCCCFSPEERLAWAHAHHVTPPSYAERPAAQGWYAVQLRDGVAAGEAVQGCAHCEESRAGQTSSPVAPVECCASHPNVVPCCSQALGRSAKNASSGPASRSPWVLGVAGLRCRGVSTLWVSTGAVLPPPMPPQWSDVLPPIGWLPQWDASSFSLLLPPPDPPPRLHS